MKPRASDILASIVVFLVALPLCMGISIASGVPAAFGLVTGIVGGIVVGLLSGAPLLVSGPAAGLTVLIWDLVTDHGIQALGPVVLLGGLLQIIAGRVKIGQWFRAMSPAVIYGMLAGIGVLIFASQFHVMLDDKPKSSGLDNLLSIPSAIVHGIFPIDGSPHELAAVIGLITIGCLVGWEKLKRGKMKFIPGALVAVLVASGIAAGFRMPVQFVQIPESLLDSLTVVNPGNLQLLLNGNILLAAAALAFIASAETLLAAAAVDRMQTIVRSDYDKELSAQGVGNMICGALGVLPMTGVIVRSSANVQAGAQTRWSAVFHGVWLLALVVLLPFLLRMIPVSALGAILVYTGYKLVDVKSIKRLAEYGRVPVLIYFATMVTIVCTDLLTGVITGIVLSLAKLIYHITHIEVHVQQQGTRVDVQLVGAATFVMIPKLAAALESLPPESNVHLDIRRLAHIDHSCLDLLKAWREQHEKQGGTVILEMDALQSRYVPIGQSPVLAVQESMATRR